MTPDDFVKLAPLATLVAALVAFVGAYVAARTGARIAGEYKLESERLAALREWRREQVERVLGAASDLHRAVQDMQTAAWRGDRQAVGAAIVAFSTALNALSTAQGYGLYPLRFFGCVQQVVSTATKVQGSLDLSRPLASISETDVDRLAGHAVSTAKLSIAIRELYRAAEEYVFERPATPPWWRRLWGRVARRGAGRAAGPSDGTY